MGRPGRPPKNRDVVKSGSYEPPIVSVREDDTAFTENAMSVLMMNTQISMEADRSDPETLYNCLHKYFKMCAERGLHITQQGAFHSVGMSKRIVDAMLNGVSYNKDPRYKAFAEYLYQCCSEYREMQMANGKIHPVTGIFWQKIYDNYVEPKNNVNEAHDALGEVKSSSEILEKYKDIIDD